MPVMYESCEGLYFAGVDARITGCGGVMSEVVKMPFLQELQKNVNFI
jgi:hypothetical protein